MSIAIAFVSVPLEYWAFKSKNEILGSDIVGLGIVFIDKFRPIYNAFNIAWYQNLLETLKKDN